MTKEIRKALWEKFWEALSAVLPVSVMILIIALTPLVGVTVREAIVFIFSAVSLIIGITLFNLGADLAMTPMGQYMGEGLTKTGRISMLLFSAFSMGVLITIAEPDLAVLAGQVNAVINGGLLILAVGVGVGLMLFFSVLKIVLHRDLNTLLIFFYFAMFAIAALLLEQGDGSFLPLSFDSGGVTTGPITVPFIMALGVGIAMSIGGRDANENSFGLIALCSAGPILAVMLLSFAAKGNLTYEMPDESMEQYLGSGLLTLLGERMLEVARSLLLLYLLFAILQKLVLRLPRKKLKQIAIGILYAFAGLVIFLTSVTVGFMPLGYRLGRALAGSHVVLLAFSFVIGLVVVLAEPAVHVLTIQVEDITNGEVTRLQMMIALSLGVGFSIGLSILRIILAIPLLWFLIIGYLISLGLSFFVPKIYTAIAFDSGGVASGPLTTGFILPFATGVCAEIMGKDAVLSYAFGIVAMVAMAPLITIQALGFRSILMIRARKRAATKKILSAEDDQIIYFDWEDKVS